MRSDAPVVFALILVGIAEGAGAQDLRPQDVRQQIQTLTDASARTQAQLEQPQRRLEEMRRALANLQQQVTHNGGVRSRVPRLRQQKLTTPTLAIPAPGSSGASIKQAILGFDAQGPHLFGGRSYGDLRIDFDGNPQSASGATYTGAYTTSAPILRLRTAHAGLQWKNTTAGFSLDRPIEGGRNCVEGESCRAQSRRGHAGRSVRWRHWYDSHT